jgi:hypothetical protein
MTNHTISRSAPHTIYDGPRMVAVYVRADEAAQALADRTDAIRYRSMLLASPTALPVGLASGSEPEEVDG